MLAPKGKKCLNCEYEYPSDADSFCPECGQKNSNLKVGFFSLFVNFFEESFSFDSRFLRSVYRLFRSPGLLTLEYNEGKRARFVPPLRMFLFSGLIFFFFFNLRYGADFDQVRKNLIIENEEVSEAEKKMRRDSALNEMKKDLTELLGSDIDTANLVKDLGKDTSTLRINLGGEHIKIDDFPAFMEMCQNLSPEAVVDSLGVTKEGYTRVSLIQFAKIAKDKGGNLFSFFFGSLSLMMLFMVPFISLILMLIYIRNKKYYYIDHIIFVLHFHVFVYLILALYLLLYSFTKPYWLIVFLGILIYAFIALRRVYSQSNKKTLLKLWLLTNGYFFSLFIFIMITFIISFYLF